MEQANPLGSDHFGASKWTMEGIHVFTATTRGLITSRLLH